MRQFSCRLPEIRPRRNIYTTEIGKCYKLGLCTNISPHICCPSTWELFLETITDIPPGVGGVTQGAI